MADRWEGAKVLGALIVLVGLAVWHFTPVDPEHPSIAAAAAVQPPAPSETLEETWIRTTKARTIAAPAATAAGRESDKPSIKADVQAMPAQEQLLIDTVRKFSAAYASQPNDMLKGAERPKRRKAICAFIHGKMVNWTGKIETLSSNNEGKGVLAIRISDEILFTTNNNAFGDIGSETLIPTESALFASASALRIGQPVIFSGLAFYNADDCMREISLTVESAMTDPEFLMRFTAVAPIQ